ncbi:chromatin associated protein KTI12 [Aspergillus karnatakaensis]|uniref:putative RNA polymerase II Elongator complex associated protein Kti12 n=1 Tax=Aspergillus karnatakaensis TaxID=1810916 RepID=UPI003CCDF7E5
MLGRDSFVILDGMNYIKGYRYQLWCEAKALGTSCCVVHVGTPIDQCIANNEARIRRKNESQPSESNNEPAKQTEAENESLTSPSEPSTDEHPKTTGHDSTESDPYPPDLLNNLIFRYEEPSMHSRWDKPLFTVPWSDAEPPIAEIWTALTGLPHPSTLNENGSQEEIDQISPLAEALTSITLSSAASTTTARTSNRPGSLQRPSGRLVIKPHQATLLPASTTTASSALYSMEKHTSAIVSAIRSFTLANPSAKAALTSPTHTSTQNGEKGLTIPVPHTETPIFIPSHIVLASVTDDLSSAGGILALPRLQRLRRQWITMNRAYIGGPHASSKGGGLKEDEVGGAFVRFLNADFGDDDETERQF